MEGCKWSDFAHSINMMGMLKCDWLHSFDDEDAIGAGGLIESNLC
jgi:hypothetical protein